MAAASNTWSEGSLPERIGKYRLVRELGRGAASRAFLAEDPFFSRQVAIKVIDHEGLNDPRMRSRFQGCS